MAPGANKDHAVVRKEEKVQEMEMDEGFDSPSVHRAGLAQRNSEDDEARRRSSSDTEAADSQASSVTSSGNSSVSDNDSGSQVLSDVEDDLPRSSSESGGGKVGEVQGKVEGAGASCKVVEKDCVEVKAETLAECIVFSLLGKSRRKTEDDVERTLLRCVRIVMQKHEIFLKGMMRRLDITRETGYVSFVAVANELFEGEKMKITWGRIVALYAFGGQLALYCKEKNMEDFAVTIAGFMGKYSSEVVAPFVRKVGGWNKICEEYPAEDDLENKAWRFLTWTAIGLGIAATASFFTSH